MNRTISQLFYDSMISKDHSHALNCIEKFGPEKSGALQWLVIRGVIEPYWIDPIKDSLIQPSPEVYDNAILQLMASKSPWEYKSDFFDFLLTKSSPDFFSMYPFHHASFHGSHQSFKSLEEKYKNEKGCDFDYNNISSDGHTPLYLALSEMKMDTVISILRRGGLGTFMLKEKKENITVIQKVFKEKSFNLTAVKNFWSSAQDKAKLLDDLNQDKDKSYSSRSTSRKF